MEKLTPLETLLPELRAYARSLCASVDAAEDLVQDAIERCLRTDTAPERTADLRPWVFRVIRNLHYDELRKHRVRREYKASEQRLSRDTHYASDAARDVLVRLAYARLDPEKREILFLVDIMGLKYAEAAGVIGVATGTVMSRISRARRALREAVDGTGRHEATMKKKATDK